MPPPPAPKRGEPVRSAAEVRVAAPGFAVLGLDAKAADFYSDQVSQQLAFQGLKVVTRSEIQALIGLERQKQLLGCGDDSSSCAAELAGAIGSDALLVGDVAKVGDKYRLSVRTIRATNGERLSSAVVTGNSEDGILDAFRLVAPRLAQETTVRFRGEKVPASSAPTLSRTGIRQFFWIPAVVGAAAVGGGAFGMVQARTHYDALRSATALEEPEPSRLRNEGQRWQTVGMIGFGLGAAALVTSAGMLLFGSESVVEAGVSIAPTGATFGIAGAF